MPDDKNRKPAPGGPEAGQTHPPAHPPAEADRLKQELDDELEQELEDTFPASDPPSITQPVHPSRDEDA
jgi:hypothetical protein